MDNQQTELLRTPESPMALNEAAGFAGAAIMTRELDPGTALELGDGRPEEYDFGNGAAFVDRGSATTAAREQIDSIHASGADGNT